jgi:hypothetical protein
MGWFKKKADPISDRARALNDEIAALEAQIKHLDTKLHSAPLPPRLRSTAMPHGAVANHSPPPAPPTKPIEPIFEEVDQNRLKNRPEQNGGKENGEELGIRKADLAGFWERVKNQFRGQSTSNPKLVNYLAAGGIHGLRPMRYEKRVARNRFLVVFIILLAVLIGVFAIFIRR